VELLRAATCDRSATVPEELFGLPVTVLGDHALSPTAWEVPGEEVLVTSGRLPEDPKWDNRGLRELTIPASVTRMEGYALLNCDAMHTLSLTDNIGFWGGGSIMNCRALRHLRLQRTSPEQGDTLAYFADNLSRELEVTVTETDGSSVRLIFPEYIEAYEENVPSHHFDYTIYGAGFPYHHVFRRKKLVLKDYDALWKTYLGMEHEVSVAVRIAWWRVRLPRELSSAAESAYRDYLRRFAPETVRWLLEEDDAAGLRFLFSFAEADRETLSRACSEARERGQTECLAALLEEQHRRIPSGYRKTFDL